MIRRQQIARGVTARRGVSRAQRMALRSRRGGGAGGGRSSAT